jgi:hypothetical protein
MESILQYQNIGPTMATNQTINIEEFTEEQILHEKQVLEEECLDVEPGNAGESMSFLHETLASLKQNYKKVST